MDVLKKLSNIPSRMYQSQTPIFCPEKPISLGNTSSAIGLNVKWDQRFGFSQQLKANNDWKPDMHIHTQYPYGSNVLQHIDQMNI